VQELTNGFSPRCWYISKFSQNTYFTVYVEYHSAQTQNKVNVIHVYSLYGESKNDLVAWRVTQNIIWCSRERNTDRPVRAMCWYIHLLYKTAEKYYNIYLGQYNSVIVIYRPMIYTAPYLMLLIQQIHYEGKWGGGWALESRLFGPCEMAWAIRRGPYGAQKSRDFQGSRTLPHTQVMVVSVRVHR
jgi:hypothetical protein